MLMTVCGKQFLLLLVLEVYEDIHIDMIQLPTCIGIMPVILLCKDCGRLMFNINASMFLKLPF